MKFNLDIRLPDNSNDVWSYDTEDNGIVSNRFGAINPSKNPTMEILPKFSKDDKIAIKYSNIRVLEINYGLNCNFDCTYCPQRMCKDQIHSASPKDVNTFIQKLTKAKEQGLNPSCIKNWGGEPLVYWKVFKQVIPKIRALYPNAMMSVITNGVLLTKDKIDFLVENRVGLFISHDGCIHDDKYKNTDILKDPKKIKVVNYALDKLKDNLGFMTVLTKESPNLCKKIDWFDSVFDNNKAVMAPVPLKWNNANKDTLKNFTKKEKDEITKGWYEGVTTKYNGRFMHIQPYYHFMNKIINRESIQSSMYDCEIPYHGMTLDLAGNVYNCKIRVQKTGTLENPNEILSTGNISWHNRKNCPTCPLIQVCGGGCVRQKDGWEHENTCKNSYYPMYWGMFKAAFKTLFNVEVLGIKKC